MSDTNKYDAQELQDAREFGNMMKGKRNSSTLPVIEQFRKIVTERQFGKVNGLPVDMQSANAVITVYDALSPENKAKFVSVTPSRMISIAWKLIK